MVFVTGLFLFFCFFVCLLFVFFVVVLVKFSFLFSFSLVKRSTGNCTCAEHYVGKGCQIANFTCGPCNHGTCDSTTGLCVCGEGYYGDYCDYKKVCLFVI